MSTRTYLFLALSPQAFGEVLLGMRIANELHDRGDRIVFLATGLHAELLRGARFRAGVIDRAVPSIDTVVRDVIRTERCDVVVLVDLTSTLLTLSLFDLCERFLDAIDVPIVALDVWNLSDTSGRWDTGDEPIAIPTAAARVTKRLVAVPFVRPDATPGHYDALPRIALDDGARAAARAELGATDQDRLVLTTTARWQTPDGTVTPYHRHLAEVIPPWFFPRVTGLSERVHVLHVGPEALPGARGIARYRWIKPQPPHRFHALLAAADLLVGLNTVATTITSALAVGLPVVVAVNARERGGAPPGAVRPFRVWPLGLDDFLAPLLADNPYLDAVRLVDLFEGETLETTCRALLEDPVARDQKLKEIAEYCRKVRTLPSAASALDKLLRVEGEK